MFSLRQRGAISTPNSVPSLLPSKCSNPPTDAYLKGLLAKEHIIVISALVGAELVGGLVAYELEKLESGRSEFYFLRKFERRPRSRLCRSWQ
jgi:hypothetical protein